MPDRSFSPRTVAEAFGVSESSLKRWCDRGAIQTSKTAGGHRKIPRSSILDFARHQGMRLARPELIGLPTLDDVISDSIEESFEQALRSILEGRMDDFRRCLIQLFLSGHAIWELGDKLIARIMKEVGHRWECAEVDVYQERLGCEIITRCLYELRGMVKPPAADAPLAIGGTPAGDPYSLASTLVELVLSEHGYRAVNLGSNVPLSSLERAIDRLRPRLFWLSVSAIDDVPAFVEQYNELFAKHGQQVPIILGGRALSEEVRGEIQYAVFCDRLSILNTFLSTLQPQSQHAPAVQRNS